MQINHLPLQVRSYNDQLLQQTCLFCFVFFSFSFCFYVQALEEVESLSFKTKNIGIHFSVHNCSLAVFQWEPRICFKLWRFLLENLWSFLQQGSSIHIIATRIVWMSQGRDTMAALGTFLPLQQQRLSSCQALTW